mmetsp:Transcript_46527/g.132682  ORF Transcript_46527/g.132682 Transcript_46527/m.132682 type:complete len:269 (-) Transcript_46527:41-847(-)
MVPPATLLVACLVAGPWAASALRQPLPQAGPRLLQMLAGPLNDVRSLTRNVARNATGNATDSTTRNATRNATRNSTRNATTPITTADASTTGAVPQDSSSMQDPAGNVTETTTTTTTLPVGNDNCTSTDLQLLGAGKKVWDTLGFCQNQNYNLFTNRIRVDEFVGCLYRMTKLNKKCGVCFHTMLDYGVQHYCTMCADRLGGGTDGICHLGCFDCLGRTVADAEVCIGLASGTIQDRCPEDSDPHPHDFDIPFPGVYMESDQGGPSAV